MELNETERQELERLRQFEKRVLKIVSPINDMSDWTTIEASFDFNIREERARTIEECAAAAAGALSDQGTDCPHEALRWAVAAIRKLK